MLLASNKPHVLFQLKIQTSKLQTMCDCFSLSICKFTKSQTLTPKFHPHYRSKLSFPFVSSESEASKTSATCSLSSGNNEFRAKLGFKEKDRSDGFGFSDEEGASSELLERKDKDFVPVEDGDGGEGESLVMADGRAGTRKEKQVVRRSGLLAKQVISIRSALSLGFVSQLWVDTSSWVVLFLEVRPNLLSGECERFLLEDVSQVGDVVLVADETVIENQFKMIGLETLVGYKVVTPGLRNIGKVRGYTFDINSGAIESLELDSFGISIIPSSLVSTYALLVEDVLDVLSDAIVVHEAAASRIQRLTKYEKHIENVAQELSREYDFGFLDSQSVGTSIDDFEEYSNFEGALRPEQNTRSSRTRRPRRRKIEVEEDWDLPMDYL